MKNQVALAVALILLAPLANAATAADTPEPLQANPGPDPDTAAASQANTAAAADTLAAPASGAAANVLPPASAPNTNSGAGALPTEPDIPSTPGLVPQPALDGLSATPALAGSQTPRAQPPALTPDSCTTADCLGVPAAAAVRRRPWSALEPAVHISEAARRAALESSASADNPLAMPTGGSGGRVLFPFNESVPAILCAPLKVCDIELQPGEIVQGSPHIGDGVRWKVAPAISGSDEHRVVHLIIKPTEAGLDTNLVVPTDRHTYHLRLISSAHLFVSNVAFSYPEDQQQAWTELSRTLGHSGPGGLGAADMPTVAVNRLNFNYRIKIVRGKPTFRPMRAMDDGYHTYIAMNEDLVQGEAPMLIGLTPNGHEQMINYRLKGNLYVLDGIVSKLALVSGVGRDQQRIELTRDPCQHQGWLGMCWDAKE